MTAMMTIIERRRAIVLLFPLTSPCKGEVGSPKAIRVGVILRIERAVRGTAAEPPPGALRAPCLPLAGGGEVRRSRLALSLPHHRCCAPRHAAAGGCST